MTTTTPAACDSVSAGAGRSGDSAHPGATLAATILGSSIAFIDGSVVNVALPALAKDLGASAGALSWTINAYLLPLGALILLGGGAGDHFGRRRLFLMGLAIFMLASILCAISPSLAWLLLGRGLQGLGAALLMPNSLAILGATFSGEARGKAIGTWAAVGALAGAVGPLMGGWLVDTVGWRSIFLLNVPIASAAAWLAWKYVAESGDRHTSAVLDWAGATLATAALGLLAWALTVAATSTGSSWPVFGALAGLSLLCAFVGLERHLGARAIMPLALFSTRTFVGLTLLTFFLYGALSGLVVLLPFLLIRFAGWSAIGAGAALLPLPIVVGLGSRLMGRLTAHLGGRMPLSVGALIVAMGLALFARITVRGIGYWTDILPGTLLVAIGMTAAVAPLTTTVMAAVDAEHIGAASGFNSAVARIAGLIATALLGFVFVLQGSAPAFIAGFRAAAWVGAGSAALAAICALLLISGAPEHAPQPKKAPAPRKA